MFHINQKIQSWRRRDGISIIEVLTSMAVAAIGVFGVMVMIPFAVKQSQTGLNADAANVLGRNAVDKMHINGLLRVNNLGDFTNLIINARVDGDTSGARTPRPCSTQQFAARDRAPGLFHFDPIGFADPDESGPLTGLTSFVIDDVVGGDNIEISSTTVSRNASVSLTFPAGGPFTVREASRFCRSSDEIFHETEEFEIAPPQPLFDQSGTERVKRQYSGRTSWSAFLVPEKDPALITAPANRYRTHVVVYRDRFIDQSPLDETLPLGPTKKVISNYGIYETNMAGVGYRESVQQVTFDPANSVDTSAVVRGSWVMLVNRIPLATTNVPVVPGTTPPVPAAGEGYRIQLGFARVTRVSNDGTSVILDGGSFNFVPAGVPAIGPEGSSSTYLVHLKDAVNVYERSVSVER